MGEPRQITFTFQEVVEALVKRQDLHEGIWGIFIRFGIQGANIGDSTTKSPDSLRPAAIVPLLEIGLQKFDEVSAISVDAAQVNPKVGSTATKNPPMKRGPYKKRAS